jgi:hypothetical protein
MNPTSLVALVALLSAIPACAGGTGESASPQPPGAPSSAGDWACLATAAGASAPPLQSPTTTTPVTGNRFTVHLSEAYTSVGVSHVTVTACAATDDACASPIAQAQTDDVGLVTLSVADGSPTFAGYLRVSGPGMTENDVFLAGRALAYGDAALDLVVYTPSALALTADTLAGALAAGVAVTLGSSGAPTSTRYFVGDGAALSPRADATDASGVALGLGVSPGALGVTAKVDGLPAGDALAFVHAGAVTSLVVRP